MLKRAAFLLFPLSFLFLCEVIGQDKYFGKNQFRVADLPPTLEFKSDVIIVKLRDNNKPGYTITAIQKDLNAVGSQKAILQKSSDKNRSASKFLKHDLSRIYKIKLAPGDNLESRINQLRRMENVEYAEPSYMPRPLLVPNDPDAEGGGVQDYLEVIKAYQAWNIERGDTAITIAILDTGADFLHEDLINNIQYNHDDPINGIDDDNDGYIDNYYGWDFGDNDNDPMADLDHHGTNVAGLCASTNNGVGLAGVGFDCRFLPIKMFKSEGNSFNMGYEAIIYAAEQGADVINLSWGAPSAFSSYEQDIINHVVEDLNAVVVAAAGNTNAELDFYPASYTNVLSVGASKINDEKTNFGTFSNFIDLMAPGESVYTTTNNNNYRFAQGSSFSAPMVAGAAALLKSRFPELSAAQIMEKLRVNADPIDHLPANTNYKEMIGKGRLNIQKALIDQSSPSVRMKSFQYSNGQGEYAFFGDSLEISVDLINYLTPTQNARIVMSTSSPYVTLIDSVFQVGSLGTLQSLSNHSSPFRVYLSPETPVNHRIKFRLGIEDGFYQDYQYLNIETEREYVNFKNEVWSITVSSNGNLGFNKDVLFGGEGLSYQEDFLSEQMGFVHNNSDNTISDNIISDLENHTRQQDFTALKNIRLSNGSFADLELKAEFRDLAKNYIHIEQKTFLWEDAPENDLTVFEYRLSNQSGLTIPVLSGAMFFDINLDQESNNKVDYNASHDLVFAFNNENNTYVGLALIQGENPIPNAIDIGNFNGNSSDIGGIFDKNEKKAMLSTSVNQAGNIAEGNDVAIMMAGSGSTVTHGSSIKLAFTLVAGNSLSELQNKVDLAKSKYEEVGQNPSELAFFQVCSMDQALIDPPTGEIFEFYDDKDRSTLLFTGDMLVTAPLTKDTSFYVVNIDSTYQSELFRVNVAIADPDVNFSMSSDTLFLDGINPPIIEFNDLTKAAQAWAWDFGNGFQSSVAHPAIQFESTGLYPIQLTVTNSTGCTGSITRNLVVVERGMQPILQDIIICQDESVLLDPDNITNINVYSDPDLNNLVFSGTSFTLDILSSDTIFYVTGNDSEYESLAEQVNITLDDLIVDFEVVVDTLDLTNRNLLILHNHSQGNAFNEWVINGEFYSTNEQETFTLDNENTVEIELFVTSNNGCVDSKTITLNIETSPTPVVNDLQICQMQPVTISASNGEIFYFYADEGQTSLLHKGKYYITEPISSTTSIFISNFDNYRESPVIEVNISFNQYETSFTADRTFLNILEENQISFMDTSPGAVSWLWDFGNGQTSIEQNPIANYELAGDYTVTLSSTNSQGCSDIETLEIQAKEVLGLDDHLQHSVKIYPNPVHDILTIDTKISPEYVSILDIYGRRVLESTTVHSHQLDVVSLPSGIYILQLEIKGTTYSLRFFKQD